MGKQGIDPKVQALHQYLMSKRDVEVTPDIHRFNEIIKTEPETLNGIYGYLKDQPDTEVADTFEQFQEALLPKKKDLVQPSMVGAPESLQPSPENQPLQQEQNSTPLPETPTEPVAPALDDVNRQAILGLQQHGKQLLENLKNPKSDEQLRAEYTAEQKHAAKIKAFATGQEEPEDGIDSLIGSLNNIPGAFNEGTTKAVASVPKAAGIVLSNLQKLLGDTNPTEEHPLYKLGQAIEDKAKELGLTVTDPKHRNFLSYDVPNAFGSMIGMMLTGGSGGKTQALEKGASALGAVKQATPLMASGAAQTAAAEFDAAKQAGFSDDEAFKVFLKNIPGGATEAVPIIDAFGRLNKLTGNSIVNVLKAGTTNGLEEATQEGIQNWSTNLVAQGTYDPKRAQFQDMVKSMGAGFVVGFVVPGVMAAMQNQNPEVRDQVMADLNHALKQSDSKEGIVGTTVQESINKVEPKPQENAVQEPSTSSVLQHPQSGVGETGSERGRVEPSVKGNETSETQQQSEVQVPEEKQKEVTQPTEGEVQPVEKKVNETPEPKPIAEVKPKSKPAKVKKKKSVQIPSVKEEQKTTDEVIKNYEGSGLNEKESLTIHEALQKSKKGEYITGFKIGDVKKVMPKLLDEELVHEPTLKHTGVIKLTEKGQKLAEKYSNENPQETIQGSEVHDTESKKETNPKTTFDLKVGDEITVSYGGEKLTLPIRRIRKDESTWQGTRQDRSTFYVLPPDRADKPGAEVAYSVSEINLPNTETTKAEETKVVKEAEQQVESKSEELKEKVLDFSKDKKVQNNKLKDQKKDILQQMNEVNDAIWSTVKGNKEAIKKLHTEGKIAAPFEEEDALSAAKKLGYEVNDKGQIIFQVKGDGEFKLHFSTLDGAIEDVKKEFPERIDEKTPVKNPSSGGRVDARTRALNRGSFEKNQTILQNAKDNLKEATAAGNKKLIEVYKNEVDKEEKIFSEAKKVDWEYEAQSKEMSSNEEAKEFKEEEPNKEANIYGFNTDDYVNAKNNDLLGHGYSRDQVVVMNEAREQKQSNDEYIKTLESENKESENKLTEKFGRKDGKGYVTPKTKNDEWTFRNLQNSINRNNAKIKILESVKKVKQPKPQTNEHETGKRIPVQETGIQTEPSEGNQESSGVSRLNREEKIRKNEDAITGEEGQVKSGDQVSFEWLGDTKKGTVVSITGDKAKIKSGKTTYTADVSTINANYAGEQASTEKYYEPPVASPKKKAKGTRIGVSPIYGAQPKQIKQILIDLSKSIPTKIYFTRKPTPRRKSLGSYSPRSSVIAIKFSNDLDTTAHELGHAVDDFYDVLGKADDAVKKELKKLSEFGSKPPKGHPSPEEYRLGEGVAEYIRAYLVNPDEASTQFPETTDLFKSLLAKETLDSITEFGNDIRSYAGLSGHHQVMANVQFEPEKNESWWTKLVKNNSKENFELTFWDRLNQKWINSMFPFEKAVGWLLDKKSIASLEPGKNPIILAHLLNGNSEKVQDILQNGFLDEVKSTADGGFKAVRDVDPVTNKPMSLEWLLEPLDDTSRQSILDEQQEVISYMVAQRTLELEKKLERQDILTGIGAGIFQDVTVAKKRLEEFKSLPEEKRARIEEAARRYREYSNRVLRYAVEKGRMSQEAYDEITASNLDYVALQRLAESGPDEEIVTPKKKGGKSLAAPKEIIKKIKGSAKTIKNPYQALIENTISTVRESDRNEVMQAFRELLVSERKMREGEPTDLGKVGHQVSKGTPNSITVFVDGTPEYWKLDDDVYRAVKNITESGYKIPGFFTALPRLLRWTVTNFPVFAIRNRIRDFQHRLVISNTGAFTGFDIHAKKGLKEANKEAFQQFGGGQAGYYLLDHEFYNHELRKAINNLAEDKTVILSTPEKIRQSLDDKWHWYRNLISKGETATRLEEYRSAFKKAKEKGMDDYNAAVYAAYQARDLMDFAIAGEYARVMNQVLPFTNAAIRGLEKSVRSAKENPRGFAVRFALYSVVPTVLARMLVHLLDKDKEYEEMPDWRRDMFYNIPIAPDKWLVIPKSFEIGTLASGIDRLISYQAFDDKNAFKGYGGSLAQSTLPVSLDDMAGPYRNVIGVMTNYDFFTKKNIIPTYETGKALELRHTERASRIGKALSPVIQVDPRYIDYLVKSNLSYFGQFALKASDIGREDSKNKFGLSDTGLVRNDPVYESKTVQTFMDFQKKYGIPYNQPMVREFDHLLKKYYDAEDPEAKKEASRNAIIFAKTSLQYFEEHKEQLIKKYSRKK